MHATIPAVDQQPALRQAHGAALEAVNVSKKYGARNALCGVSLTAQPGRLHGLLGPNGAGKTTLMRIALGLVRPDEGTVRLLGSGVNGVDRGVPDGVAGLVETPAFYPYLTGRKNLSLLARLDNVDGSSLGRKVDHLLEQTGLAQQADLRVSSYSAGMRQRLGLAASLLRSPALLLLDEPTSSLDPAGARDMRALATRLADEGAAVVFSSHDMTEVEELCREITVLDRGRVVFSGTIEDFRRRAPSAVHYLQTSDDNAAMDLARYRPGVDARRIEGGLEVSAETDALDAYVIALGQARVAVRLLERRTRSLESLFLELTEDADHADHTGRADPTPAPPEMS
jgi:ABC-2 type transport system ATP-binding protein